MSNFVEIRPASSGLRCSSSTASPRASRRTTACTRGTWRSATDPRALADVDLTTANQVYSDVRALKVDLTFAIGGIKNHEVYFSHLGGGGGDPDGAIGALVERDFGSADTWRADLFASEHGRPGLGMDL